MPKNCDKIKELLRNYEGSIKRDDDEFLKNAALKLAPSSVNIALAKIAPKIAKKVFLGAELLIPTNYLDDGKSELLGSDAYYLALKNFMMEYNKEKRAEVLEKCINQMRFHQNYIIKSKEFGINSTCYESITKYTEKAKNLLDALAKK